MYILFLSNNKNKKFGVYDIINDKTLHFGDSRYKDYIVYNQIDHNLANERKQLYINRHKNEDWNDLSKAGTWSRYILWNKPTLIESIEDMQDKFDIIIKAK